ncbi:hypothetical protein NMY22_g4308 [Coprinellus aureogranulatus]|nr:hypothetical protein NMY22_g4308 [Coprinellus aureogranulatus]
MPFDSAAFGPPSPNPRSREATSSYRTGGNFRSQTVEATPTSVYRRMGSPTDDPRSTLGKRRLYDDAPVPPQFLSGSGPESDAVHYGIPPESSSHFWTQSSSSSASLLSNHSSASALERPNDPTAPTFQSPQHLPAPNASHYQYHHYGSTCASDIFANLALPCELTTFINPASRLANTTTTHYGSVTHVKHIEHANFQTTDSMLLWNDLPKQRDTSGQRNVYMEGSREADVQKIFQWINHAPPGELVLWVQGPAGVGKSTFARHLTYRLRATNRLAASVFLTGLPNDARSPESVVKIMARELATTHASLIPLILSAVSACNGASLLEHLKKFLRDPVHSLRRSYSLVIILDAIDEWEYSGLLVKELAQIAASPLELKFIVLGRSDPRARGFRNSDTWIQPYRLEPVSEATMKHYFIQHLASVTWDYDQSLSANQVSNLVKLANGLFIWASTVCSLLNKRLSLSSPSQTLNSILYSNRSLGAEGGLAGLYHQALSWLFPNSEGQDILKRYLGATLVLQEPLPMDAFSVLADVPIHAVRSIKSELEALQIRQPVGDPQLIYPTGTLFHLSFSQYLESLSTPPGNAFCISTFESHCLLAQSCLSKLRDFLPTAQHYRPEDLPPLETYAVKYMPLHVKQGTPSVEPGSDDDWKRTPHCSLLQEIAGPSLVQWGRLLVALVLPNHSVESEECASDTDEDDTSEDDDLDESSVEDSEDLHKPSVDDTGDLCRSKGTLIVDAIARLEDNTATLPVYISCLEVAVRLEPRNIDHWNELGWAYRNLAESTRSREHIDQAVKAHNNALEADGSSGVTDEGKLLFSLATALDDRHEYFGDKHDLSKAIVLHRRALSLRPPGHSDRDSSLNNLAIALSASGSTSDTLPTRD